MLAQCFHVLGEKKLRKMLPDEFKVICEHVEARANVFTSNTLNKCFFLKRNVNETIYSYSDHPGNGL